MEFQYLIKTVHFKGGFFRLWRREQGRESYHVDMSRFTFLLSHTKIFCPFCISNCSTFSRTLMGKPNDNQSHRIIFAIAAFLLFLSSQSSNYFFPDCHVPMDIHLQGVLKRKSFIYSRHVA